MRPARSVSPRINSKVQPATRRLLLEAIALQSALTGKREPIGSVLHAALARHNRTMKSQLSHQGVDPEQVLSRPEPQSLDSEPPDEGSSFVD